MKELQIQCSSAEEKIATIAFLYGLGHSSRTYPTFQEYMDNHHSEEKFREYPYVLLRPNIDEKTFRVDACNKEYNSWGVTLNVITFKELSTIPKWVENAIKKVTTFKISKDYDAVVSLDGIQVGCQHISFSDFNKLAKIVKTYE